MDIKRRFGGNANNAVNLMSNLPISESIMVVDVQNVVINIEAR